MVEQSSTKIQNRNVCFINRNGEIVSYICKKMAQNSNERHSIYTLTEDAEEKINEKLNKVSKNIDIFLNKLKQLKKLVL